MHTRSDRASRPNLLHRSGPRRWAAWLVFCICVLPGVGRAELPQFDPSGEYRITNDAVPGKSLALGPKTQSGSSTIQLAPTDDKDPTQRWKVETLKPGFYRLSNQHLGDGLALNSMLQLGESGSESWGFFEAGSSIRIHNGSDAQINKDFALDYANSVVKMWKTTTGRTNQQWKFTKLVSLPQASVSKELLSARYEYGDNQFVDPLTNQGKRIPVYPAKKTRVQIWLTKKPASRVKIEYKVYNKDGSCDGGKRGDCNEGGFIAGGSPMDGDPNRMASDDIAWMGRSFTVPFSGSRGKGLSANDLGIVVSGNPYLKGNPTRDFYISFKLTSEDPAYNGKPVPALQFRLSPAAGDPEVYAANVAAAPSTPAPGGATTQAPTVPPKSPATTVPPTPCIGPACGKPLAVGSEAVLYSTAQRRLVRMNANGTVDGGAVIATPTQVLSGYSAERFRVVDGGNGLVALYNVASRRFLRISDRGEAGAAGQVDMSLPNDWTWERFQVVEQGDGVVALYNPRVRRFLRMTDKGVCDGSVAATAALPAAWTWERFRVVTLPR